MLVNALVKQMMNLDNVLVCMYICQCDNPVLDRDGMALWYKRLEAGTFPFPAPGASKGLSVTPSELSLLLRGVNPATLTRRRRFELNDSQNIS
ncbi:MAG: transposase [Planctomycetota bacterium]|jgi:hypothetical protein|nr:transposase [Planctomycetota bacterium]